MTVKASPRRCCSCSAKHRRSNLRSIERQSDGLMPCRLCYQDSRGLAAMLKELSKSGHGQQALELFDWLQNLPPNHDLAPLADVFSFTTGIFCAHKPHLACISHRQAAETMDLITSCLEAVAAYMKCPAEHPYMLNSCL